MTSWISEVECECETLVAQLGQAVPDGNLTHDQLEPMATSLRDIVAMVEP